MANSRSLVTLNDREDSEQNDKNGHGFVLFIVNFNFEKLVKYLLLLLYLPHFRKYFRIYLLLQLSTMSVFQYISIYSAHKYREDRKENTCLNCHLIFSCEGPDGEAQAPQDDRQEGAGVQGVEGDQGRNERTEESKV